MFDGKTVKGYFYFSLVREENVENEEIPSLKTAGFYFDRCFLLLSNYVYPQFSFHLIIFWFAKKWKGKTTLPATGVMPHSSPYILDIDDRNLNGFFLYV